MFIVSMLHLSAAAEVNKEGYIEFLHRLQEAYPSAIEILAERAAQIARVERADFSLLRDLVHREVELQNQVSELAEAGIFDDLDNLQVQLSTVREEITDALERMEASGRRSPTPPPSPARRALSPDFQRVQRLAGDDAAHLEEEGDLPEETAAQKALSSRERYFARLEVLRGVFRERLAGNPRLLEIVDTKIDELKARFRDDFVPPIGDEFQAVIRTLDRLLLNLARAQALALSMEVRELTLEEEEILGASWRAAESFERQLLLDLETGGHFAAKDPLERESPVAMRTPSPIRGRTPPRRRSPEPQEQQRQPSPVRTAAAAMAAPLPPAPMTERERLEAEIQDTELKLKTAQGPGVFALEARLRRLRDALAKL